MLTGRLLRSGARCLRSISEGCLLSPAQRTLATFIHDSKRFYKDIDVIQTDAGYQIRLDNKGDVKTPLRNLLVLPTEKLADAVAVEWDSQKEHVIFALMPLTTLCYNATDKHMDNAGLIEHMLEFLRTDTVCYRAHVGDTDLHTLENSMWNPLTEWFSRNYHVHLALTTDIMLTPQSEQTVDKLRKHMAGLHPWTIPAYHHSTTSLKSLVIAMSMLDGGLSAEEAIRCSYLETDYQIDRWGEVEWQHTLDRARLSADVAAAVLLVAEIKSLDVAQRQAIM